MPTNVNKNPGQLLVQRCFLIQTLRHNVNTKSNMFFGYFVIIQCKFVYSNKRTNILLHVITTILQYAFVMRRMKSERKSQLFLVKFCLSTEFPYVHTAVRAAITHASTQSHSQYRWSIHYQAQLHRTECICRASETSLKRSAGHASSHDKRP